MNVTWYGAEENVAVMISADRVRMQAAGDKHEWSLYKSRLLVQNDIVRMSLLLYMINK